jgi:hypothetical protein
MQALSYSEIQRRETYSMGGWNLADDDTPRPPEMSPLDSAQCRRWARDEHRSALHTLPVDTCRQKLEPTPYECFRHGVGGSAAADRGHRR